VLDELTAGLGPEQAVLAYGVLGDRLLCWAARRGTAELEALPISPRGAQRLVRQFAAALATGAAEAELERLAEELHAALLEPLRNHLAGARELIVIPDRFLHLIPFAALRSAGGGGFVFEGHSVVLAPSAWSVLGFLEERRRPARPRAAWSAVVVSGAAFLEAGRLGLPPLPAAEEELRLVADLYSSTQFLQGPEATRRAFLRALDSGEVLHYAGHAVPGGRDPWYSYFPLAPEDGSSGPSILYAHELAGRPFARLRLAVLSACSTAGVTAGRAGGLAGLGRPFLDRGAATLASLWPVEDRAAKQLITGFHRRLLAGEGAAQALRGAQLELLESPDPGLNTPAAWAAFQLIGDLPPEPRDP
jgi:CHAT domain-containing protein